MKPGGVSCFYKCHSLKVSVCYCVRWDARTHTFLEGGTKPHIWTEKNLQLSSLTIAPHSRKNEVCLSTALFHESCHFLVCRERAVGRAPEGLFHLRPSIGLLPTPTVGITSLHCFLLISFSLTLHDAVIPFHCGFSDCWDLDLVRSSAGGRRDYKWPTRDCWDWLVESDDGFQRGHTDGSDRD